MPIETIEFQGETYPKFQSEGNAALWVREFALRICQPVPGLYGLDIGCNRLDWCLPNAIPIDPLISDRYDAYNLPKLFDRPGGTEMQYDYLFSSHCCEHLPNYVAAIDYWATRLKTNGNLFLYLPDMTVQKYWAPSNNLKHLHFISPDVMRSYFDSRKNIWKNVFVSSWDINYSFTCIAEKA